MPRHTALGRAAMWDEMTTVEKDAETYISGYLYVVYDTTLGELQSTIDGGSTWLEVGGTGGSTLPVEDTTALVKDPADGTKKMRIDVGAVTTATERTLTMPDQDIDLTQVSAGEIEDGTETATRSYSPADIVALIDEHADGGGSSAQILGTYTARKSTESVVIGTLYPAVKVPVAFTVTKVIFSTYDNPNAFAPGYWKLKNGATTLVSSDSNDETVSVTPGSSVSIAAGVELTIGFIDDDTVGLSALTGAQVTLIGTYA